MRLGLIRRMRITSEETATFGDIVQLSFDGREDKGHTLTKFQKFIAKII